MAVPSFLLKKLYVQGSLKNTENGFEFALRNNLAPGSLIGFFPLTVDDSTVPPQDLTFHTAQGEVRGDQVSSRSPLTFGLNAEVRIAAQGKTLQPGSHHLILSVLTREVGRIDIDVTDTL
ncbi:MAG: hydroxymethylglutaryl-CoA reductase [Anaerolineae bacterium]|nr:hydroxymethylglutaryl-CoA reductase [Anaerolineae bacterium]